MPNLPLHLELSHKLVYDDLDWALARKHGITPTELECLQFFADIESQTVFYMMEVAKLKVVRQPELLAFLTVWNYEEFFHAQAISRFLDEVGHPAMPASERSSAVRRSAQLRAKIEDYVQITLSKATPTAFIALWQMWGAAAELITTQAYEEIARTTENPVLAELCRRIAKQERRHFAWYFETARERLEGQTFSQWLSRKVFELNWTPVGSGVKTPTQIAELIARLFPGPRIYEVFATVDKRMAQLPGMAGFDVCSKHADKIQALLPPAARVVRDPSISSGIEYIDEPISASM